MSNPIYGNLQDTKNEEKKSFSRKREARARSKGASFSTHTSSVETQSAHKPHETGKEKSCLFCHDKSHSLAGCGSLQEKPIEQRLKFVKEEGLCFGCLKKASHIAKDCKKQKVQKCDFRLSFFTCVAGNIPQYCTGRSGTGIKKKKKSTRKKAVNVKKMRKNQ